MAGPAPTGIPNVPDPTAGFGTLQNQTYLTAPEISQWANYFAGDTGQTTTNQLVQTGTQFTPTMPWLTSGQQSPGMVTGQPGQTNTSLNLPWGSLGIQQSSDPQTMANNINASPFAGSNPSNPYYNLILNQASQGNLTPTYTNEQVTTQGGPYASIQNGQLTGQLTPEEQQLLTFQYGGVPEGQLPYFMNQVNQLTSGGVDPTQAQQQVLQQLGYGVTQLPQNYGLLYGAGSSPGGGT